MTTPGSVLLVTVGWSPPSRKGCHRDRFGETEVQNLDDATLGQEHVFWLQVPVHDSSVVRGCDSLGDLPTDVNGFDDRQFGSRETAAERFAVKQLGHDVGYTIGLADIVNGEHIRMAESARNLGLLDEATDQKSDR